MRPEKQRILIGQTWKSKDRRDGERTIVIRGKLPDGRFKADSFNFSRNTLVSIRLQPATIRARFTLTAEPDR